MTYRFQPADLVAAPPTYAAPDLEAPGRVVTVRLERALGFLVTDDLGGLAFWGLYRDDDEDAEVILRDVARRRLRASAAEALPASAAWDAVLRLVPHDPPVRVARLATVAAVLG
jgi:hypothetical protein